MSSKRYRYKVIESGDPAELTRLLAEAGTQGWSAVGYGVLPSGERSALLSRKFKVHGHKHRHRHDHSRDEDRHAAEGPAPADSADKPL